MNFKGIVRIFKKKKKLNAIERFRDKRSLLISYNQLAETPLNEVIQINEDSHGSIECTRITSNSDNTLIFTVSMKKGQLWESHFHDCFETCVIFKGRLTDTNTGKSAGAAEAIHFGRFTEHHVVAEKDSIFYVEFRNPNNKE